jgi:L-amino acid N-acyltransferase YncA
MIVRPAAAPDAEAIARIYSEGIAGRQATFETSPRGAADVAPWIGDERQPLLVAERGGDVLGWARAIRSSDRCAYEGVGEYTIYVDEAARGQGVGAALLQALVEVSDETGFWKLIGKLFTTNAPTIALARRLGFREVGVHERHGRLDGEWRDVLIVERLLSQATRER